ncbi:hypothetical protein TPHA_0O00210 [Tetrapisispora phaffii CBS 4417]|uniref:Inosine triphosphate pyrophosphatase n=1 Tax=Tetrapisispora phaffii (strain ATCC 24235 / CBS 4417 / NBRC 1672 / NRRL Y-8282 / UCD 70-5) TaxID=1071381 RepID=G8C1G5_TETPH|nr:hypothetical protein TPHA_0O00210 [Tetrapisispora phaffii CBS 4417]CCE65993.1 hypothetical protein TPHA_0O00210 [Tetrapisispora phaffii CBS 4417]
MSQQQEIIFVTGNANKLKEVQQILKDAPCTLTNVALDLDELQGSSLEAVATAKLKQAVVQAGSGKAIFVEDTALSFTAFNGLPGAYIKWFVQSMGLAKIVQMLDAFEDKSAQAITTIAYADAEGQTHVFKGITDGTIVASRGPTDFGWDSIFEPYDSHGKTYAEMDKPSKNKISHRGKAFEAFKSFLQN